MGGGAGGEGRGVWGVRSVWRGSGSRMGSFHLFAASLIPRVKLNINTDTTEAILSCSSVPWIDWVSEHRPLMAALFSGEMCPESPTASFKKTFLFGRVVCVLTPICKAHTVKVLVGAQVVLLVEIRLSRHFFCCYCFWPPCSIWQS